MIKSRKKSQKVASLFILEFLTQQIIKPRYVTITFVIVLIYLLYIGFAVIGDYGGSIGISQNISKVLLRRFSYYYCYVS